MSQPPTAGDANPKAPTAGDCSLSCPPTSRLTSAVWRTRNLAVHFYFCQAEVLYDVELCHRAHVLWLSCAGAESQPSRPAKGRQKWRMQPSLPLSWADVLHFCLPQKAKFIISLPRPGAFCSSLQPKPICLACPEQRDETGLSHLFHWFLLDWDPCDGHLSGFLQACDPIICSILLSGECFRPRIRPSFFPLDYVLASLHRPPAFDLGMFTAEAIRGPWLWRREPRKDLAALGVGRGCKEGRRWERPRGCHGRAKGSADSRRGAQRGRKVGEHSRGLAGKCPPRGPERFTFERSKLQV